MGDDLNFAQKFTRTAADGLALIAEMENPRAAHDASVVIDMMTTVQRGAKRLRARNIYTGAQGVLSALHHENDTVLSGRIDTLGSLVTEYARGLEDLLQTTDNPTVEAPADKWEIARATLNDLLPIASADDADMLSRLMRAPVTLEGVQPDIHHIAMDADIVPFKKAQPKPTAIETVLDTFETESRETTSIELTDNLIEVPETAKVPTEAPISAPIVEDAPIIALDAMMRDVIADALSVARSVDRTISLSYDMGDRNISEQRATDLRTRLGKALSQIIRQSMTSDRVGHIDINLAGEQLHIMAGTTALRVAIDPKTAPKPKRLITQETESELRDQLNALMDPVSLHETAS